MKYTSLLLAVLFFFLNCTNKQKDKIIVSQKKESKKRIDSMNLLKRKKGNLTTEVDSLMRKPPKECNVTFSDFFERFSKDEFFQKSRVRFPLKYSFIEDLETERIGIRIVDNIKEYHYIDFVKDKYAMKSKYDKYSVSIETQDDNVNYKHIGFDNGISITYKFKLIDKCWFLVEIIDDSA